MFMPGIFAAKTFCCSVCHSISEEEALGIATHCALSGSLQALLFMLANVFNISRLQRIFEEGGSVRVLYDSCPWVSQQLEDLKT